MAKFPVRNLVPQKLLRCELRVVCTDKNIIAANCRPNFTNAINFQVAAGKAYHFLPISCTFCYGLIIVDVSIILPSVFQSKSFSTQIKRQFFDNIRKSLIESSGIHLLTGELKYYN